MTHLSPAELVDHLDGRLPAARREHLDRCGACRDEVASLGAVLSELAVDAEPAPSPMFWEHFRAQTAARVAAAPAPAPWWQVWAHTPGRVTLAAAASIALLIAGARVLPRSSDAPSPAGGDVTLEDPVAEEAWAEVRAAAEQVGWDDVREAGVTTRPGQTDGELLRLNEAERRQLLLLLEEAMKRDGA